MRARKWLYLAAIIVALLRHGWFSLANLEKITPYIAIPQSVALTGAIIFTVYSSVIYLLLIVQYGAMIDRDIVARLRLRDAERVARIQERMSEVKQSVDGL
jgi:hypothetical protein